MPFSELLVNPISRAENSMRSEIRELELVLDDYFRDFR